MRSRPSSRNGGAAKPESADPEPVEGSLSKGACRKGRQLPLKSLRPTWRHDRPRAPQLQATSRRRVGGRHLGSPIRHAGAAAVRTGGGAKVGRLRLPRHRRAAAEETVPGSHRFGRKACRQASALPHERPRQAARAGRDAGAGHRRAGSRPAGQRTGTVGTMAARFRRRPQGLGAWRLSEGGRSAAAAESACNRASCRRAGGPGSGPQNALKVSVVSDRTMPGTVAICSLTNLPISSSEPT